MIPPLRRFAPRMADTVLAVLTREYPNHLGHLMTGPDDRPRPREAHPAFYGCFDWHSAVHMTWTLLRLVPLLPEGPTRDAAESLLADHLAPDRLAVEADYLRAHPYFERPYGWAWTLQLAAEAGPDSALRPLADHLTRATLDWLAVVPGPVRYGMHLNSAFALRRMLPWARILAGSGRPELALAIEAAARRWFLADHHYPLWLEPGPYDFLSGALAEADLMAALLPAAEFTSWLDGFLPELGPLAVAVEPADRGDGQLAHLDGLNLYRCYALRSLASRLPETDGRVVAFRQAAEAGLEASLERAFGGDYMGEHWLATFALLALDDDLHDGVSA